MGIVYAQERQKFNTETHKSLHRTIFGALYEWTGEFRTIGMTKAEDVLVGDTVRYAHPSEIKLKYSDDPKTLVFKIVRITASIWHIYPFSAITNSPIIKNSSTFILVMNDLSSKFHTFVKSPPE